MWICRNSDRECQNLNFIEHHNLIKMVEAVCPQVNNIGGSASLGTGFETQQTLEATAVSLRKMSRWKHAVVPLKKFEEEKYATFRLRKTLSN